MQTYLHNKVLPGIGKIGSIFLLDTGDSSLNEPIASIASTLAMHAAAMKPSYITKDEIPEDAIEQALAEGKDQALLKMKEGMPEKAKEKMLQGVAQKAVRQLEKREALMEQELATSEASLTVAEYLKDESKRLGKEIDIKEWALFVIK